MQFIFAVLLALVGKKKRMLFYVCHSSSAPPFFLSFVNISTSKYNIRHVILCIYVCISNVFVYSFIFYFLQLKYVNKESTCSLSKAKSIQIFTFYNIFKIYKIVQKYCQFEFNLVKDIKHYNNNYNIQVTRTHAFMKNYRNCSGLIRRPIVSLPTSDTRHILHNSPAADGI